GHVKIEDSMKLEVKGNHESDELQVVQGAEDDSAVSLWGLIVYSMRRGGPTPRGSSDESIANSEPAHRASCPGNTDHWGYVWPLPHGARHLVRRPPDWGRRSIAALSARDCLSHRVLSQSLFPGPEPG